MPDDTWGRNASEWARRVEARLDASREQLVLPALVDLFAQTHAMTVLDAGCGSGTIGRMLGSFDAVEVTGVDSSRAMCDEALRAGGLARVVHADIAALPMLDSSFDAVIANMVLQAVPDLAPCCSEIARVLKPAGYFLFSILHPARVAPHTENADSTIGPVVDYGRERMIKARLRLGGPEFLPARVPYYHRTLTHYVAALRDAGLVLIDLREPTPSATTAARHPALLDFWALVPFLVCMARKSPLSPRERINTEVGLPS